MDETTEPDMTTELAASDTDTATEDAAVEDATLDEAASPGGVSRTVLIVSVLAGMLVAGLAGVIIGWKIEQQRVKDDLSNIRPIGTVSAVEDGSMTVRLSTADETRTYVITDQTVIAGAEDGEGSSVEPGSTVLVRSRSSDGELEAVEVIVLPDDTTFGG